LKNGTPSGRGEKEGLVDEAFAEGRDRRIFPVREMAKDLVGNELQGIHGAHYRQETRLLEAAFFASSEL
jgi:hypothetical protein